MDYLSALMSWVVAFNIVDLGVLLADYQPSSAVTPDGANGRLMEPIGSLGKTHRHHRSDANNLSLWRFISNGPLSGVQML